MQTREKDPGSPAAPPPPANGRRRPKPEPANLGAVYRVYNFWKDRIKASARKADALKWIERRGTEHGYERLIMATVRYKNECNDLKTEEKFYKDCANFFGEDSTYEGFLPDEDWYAKFLDKALDVLGDTKVGKEI